jgi:Ran GTPase-activating protein (RanGAP) involved in mRNA processing and transport
LQNNDTLESINVAWNGFGMEGCHEMGKALLKNKSLRELDLSSNRVSLDAFRQLLRGVGKNKTLKVLRVRIL